MSVRLDPSEGYTVQEELDYIGVHDDNGPCDDYRELIDYRNGWDDYVEEFENC